jgi:hypothetical protein
VENLDFRLARKSERTKNNEKRTKKRGKREYEKAGGKRQMAAIGQEAGNKLYSLIPLEDFKAILGLDDMEDKISRFCLVTATYSIEQFCKRRFLKKKHTDYHSFTGDHIFTLREYPVRKIISINSEQLTMNNGGIVDPKYYYKR